jgi:DNA polymerase I
LPKKLFLVDGSNHAFRVQFALPPRHASDGFPTRVLYGFTLLFQKMMRTYRPDYCVVSFDRGKTFRHEAFEPYKAQRAAMPEDLRQQWDLLPDLVRGFGYPCIIVEGFEADDVLGTLATRFAGPDLQAYIVSGDKDFSQLVNDHIHLLDERKDELVDASVVQKKFGVRPDQIIDMLGLAGDTSDNIPGVPGIGVKTAAKLLAQWETFDSVLQAAADGKIKGKRGQNLVNHAEDARISRYLATIRLDVPIAEKLADLAPVGIQEQPLRDLFDRWEFGMVARKMLPERKVVDPSNYEAVVDDGRLEEVLNEIRECGFVSVDLLGAAEASGNFIGVSLAWGEKEAVYVPWEAQPGATLDLEQVRAKLKNLLEDEAVGKMASNIKLVLASLAGKGIELRGIAGDTRLLDYALVPHRRTHGLDDLAQRHLGHNLSYQRSQMGFQIQETARQAVEPAHVAWLVHQKLTTRLSEGTNKIYRDIELPLVPVLAAMEEKGIGLDLERLALVRADIKGRVKVAETRCHDLAGRPFKVGSPKEVGTILFEELGLPASKKTKTGYSTASSVLEKLLDHHPLPSAVLEFRALSKLENTYLGKLPSFVASDGRIHTSFNQAVAATGRLSSTDPNLQNIPIRSFEGRRIRECFVPRPGNVFLSADYSQVELRVLAHFCQSSMLADSFSRGEDIHSRTASEVFGIPIDEVPMAQRAAAKAINFGLLYGMSAFRLGQDLSISREEAQKYMDDYFGRMPEVQGWLEETREYCRHHGYVETLFGRRRLIPEIYSKTFVDRMAAEREAVNTRVQGTAADIIKIAMIKVHHALLGSELRAELLLQVHDELLLEVPRDEVDATRGLVDKEMMGAAKLIVPLKVNCSVGENWNEAHG